MPSQTTEKKWMDLHPNGKYRLKIIGQALSTNKRGNMELVMKCETISLVKAEHGNPIIKPGSHVYLRMYFSELTIEKTKAFVLAAGFTGKSLRQLDPGNENFFSIAGFEFDASNKQEKWDDGKFHDKWSAFPVGGSNKWMDKLKSPDSMKVMALDQIWNATKVETANRPPAAAAKQEDEGPAPAWEPSDEEGW